MANNESNSHMSIEKLRGRDNYLDWKFQMSALLKLDGLWYCVSGSPPANLDAAAKARHEEKALSKIILSLDKSTYPHVMQSKTALEAWNALEKAFEDKGLHRRLRLLRNLCSIKLESFSNMEDYVNQIMALSQQLMSIGKPLDDEFLGVIMLQGLTDDYEPMVMALENSGIDITSDFVKTKLLQDKKWQDGKSGGDSALVARKFSKAPWCWNCRKKGHTKNQCPNENPNKNTNKFNKKKNEGNSEGNKNSTLFVAALGVDMKGDDWYIDSGASSHMTGNKDLLNGLSDDNRGQEILVANNSKLCVSGTGTSSVRLSSSGVKKNISDVKFVPNLSVNLLSVNSMVSKGYCVYFDANNCKILDQDMCQIKGEPIATATSVNGLYKLDVLLEKANIAKMSSSQMLWHKRLGHLNHYSMDLLKNGLATGMTYKHSDKPDYCESCIKGKQARKPFPNNPSKKVAEGKLDLIHSDILGPLEVESWSGCKYILTFIDDHSRKIFCYFLKSKDEAPDIFKEFCQLVENQTERKIKVLRTDNGGEYCNDRLKKFLKDKGIKHELTVPYSPQQNGVAERYNRSIMEKVRSMLADSRLPKQMWAEASNTAAYLLNRSPTKKLTGATPEEKWTGCKVDLGHLKVFGCRAYAHVPDAKRQKLDEKGKEYIFVGYSDTTVGYRLLDPKNYSLKILRDVIFLEDKFDSTNNNVEMQDVVSIELDNDSNEDLNETSSVDPQSSSGEEDVEIGSASADREEENNSACESECVDERRYPKRLSSKPKKYNDYLLSDDFDNEPDFSMLAVSHDLEPITVSEALSSAQSFEWRSAIKRELNAFKANNAWELVDKPSNKNIVKNKWVFKIKKDQNGDIATYRARLVAKGFTQKYGIDYLETYSPVIRFSNLRLLLAMTAELNLETVHLDVETAFLNGDIDEDIYMSQPEGFEEPGFENKVCLLKKAIYGLKQSSRLWYQKAHSVLLNLKFKQSEIEPCIFFKNTLESIVIVALYVDDFFIFHNNFDEFKMLKFALEKNFHIKDLGPISYCLGMKVERNRSKHELKVSQELYINKVLQRFQMTDCNIASTPLEQNLKFSNEGKFYDCPYQQLIGSIMYLAVCSRPDIAFAVSFLSQFNICHSKEQWLAAKRVLKYLKGTKNVGIMFKKSNSPVTGFVDSDWANDISDRKSYYGFIFLLANGPISWECQKQKTLALSSTEAEYIGISEATKESMYLKYLCSEIFDVNKSCDFLTKSIPMIIYNDNQSAIRLSENQTFHKRTKHIHVKYHFIREKVKNNEIQLKHMPTTEMIADMLTKSLGCKKHKFICEKLSMK